jgi:hypothetical protein
MKAWIHVLTAMAGVKEVYIDQKRQLLCQIINKRALKELIRDVLGPYITSHHFSVFGLLWRPPVLDNVLLKTKFFAPPLLFPIAAIQTICCNL